MSRSNGFSYHTARATQELDLGLRAGSSPAARAHLKLASLHMARAKALGGDVPMVSVLG